MDQQLRDEHLAGFDGLIEDIHTAEIANQYLIPFLHNLGADVVHAREHGEVDQDGLADSDAGAPGYTETGSWTTSASSGYNGGGYRYVGAAATETATATWTIPVGKDGLYPVFAWFRASANRTPQANYRIHHSGGIGSARLDQTQDNLTWAHLGNYWFTAAQGARVVLSNQSAAAGVVIAVTKRTCSHLASARHSVGMNSTRGFVSGFGDSSLTGCPRAIPVASDSVARCEGVGRYANPSSFIVVIHFICSGAMSVSNDGIP